ncbi:hypothetical protein WMR74_004403 [Providencia rettgeri]|uniref:hypothetical protein n=1 Tax=Providencia TaxID=586 RepID=UPI00234B85F6|nr:MULTISPECIES: hypothetical protein [Providencia]
MSITLKDVFELIQICADTKPQVTNRDLRCLVTKVFNRVLKNHTTFTGYVSENAVAAIKEMNGIYQKNKVVREHHQKIHKSITALIGNMRETNQWNYHLFEKKIIEFSSVNITTTIENEQLIAKNSTYQSVGIKLVHWHELDLVVKIIIYEHLLRSDIANRSDWVVA